MITFYINDFGDTWAGGVRDCRNKYIKRYLEPYCVESKIVRFNKSNPITYEFLMSVLSKQAETSRGVESITRRGMFKPCSKSLSRLAKHDAKAVRDWKLMLIDKDRPLTVKGVINWLLEHPFFVNTLIMYDDENDIYYTARISEGCKLACKRKSRSIRRKLNYEIALQAEAADRNEYMSTVGHDDFWAKQEEFDYDIL